MSGIISDNVGRASGLTKAVAAPSSDFVKLATASFANTANCSMDGYFTNVYDTYLIQLTGVQAYDTSTDISCTFRRSDTEVTASSYNQQIGRIYGGSSSDASWQKGAPYRLFYTQSNASYPNHSNNVNIWLFDPLNETGGTDRFATMLYHASSWTGSTDLYNFQGAVGLYDATTAISGFTIGGPNNININRMTLYGLK